MNIFDKRNNFSFSINKSLNDNKNNSVNDIFKFINGGKISKTSGKYINIKNRSKNLILDKNRINLSMLNKTNSFYHGPLSCYSKNISFDQKYNYDFSNSNNNLFGNKKIYNNKKKYVYEHYNKVFNNKENDKISYNLIKNKQDQIMTTINKMKKNYFKYYKKSFIDNSSPSKKYQNTIRNNCLWNKINKDNEENILLNKFKKKTNNNIIEKINKYKKELNQGIISNRSEIEQLKNLYNSNREKKNYI